MSTICFIREKRNINAKTETQRLEHVLHYLFHKKRSIYPNVISVMEWYLGMITHVINNERSWVQSTYRQNISDEILKAKIIDHQIILNTL